MVLHERLHPMIARSECRRKKTTLPSDLSCLYLHHLGSNGGAVISCILNKGKNLLFKWWMSSLSWTAEYLPSAGATLQSVTDLKAKLC